jgi:hypothetical protein
MTTSENQKLDSPQPRSAWVPWLNVQVQAQVGVLPPSYIEPCRQALGESHLGCLSPSLDTYVSTDHFKRKAS